MFEKKCKKAYQTHNFMDNVTQNKAEFSKFVLKRNTKINVVE